MKRTTKLVIAGTITLSILTMPSYIKHQQYISESQQLREYQEIIDTKFKELDKQIALEKSIEDKQKEIVEYLNSDEYAKREKINQLREQTGLNVVDYQEVEFEKTFYTSLPEENGGYTVTCNGEPLEGNIVANNVIPQYTDILLGDRLVYVGDRGAKSIFSTINRLDVLVERIPGESDKQYLKRVNNMGRQKEIGYILKVS